VQRNRHRNGLAGAIIGKMMASPTSSECRFPPGVMAPVVDRSRCEGKADCVDVCPVRVFEVRRIDDADFACLGVRGLRQVRGSVPREGDQAGEGVKG
jgi:ferredoxin